MINYYNNNKVTVISRALIGAMFAATAVIASVFNDITPAAMLFM